MNMIANMKMSSCLRAILKPIMPLALAVLAKKLPDTQEFRLAHACTELFPVPYRFLSSLRGVYYDV